MDQTAEHANASTAPSAPPRDDGVQLFAGGGEIGAMLSQMDWRRTALGPVEGWPQPLRTALDLCLNSRSPIVLWWGPEMSVFYNDAYRPSLGASKHPALGKPGSEVWPEVWPTIGPMLDRVMANGESTWSEDQLLPLDRYGFLEEVYFTYSYTPIRLKSGAVGGVFCVATETTTKVLSERRLRVARDLAAAVVEAHTADEVCERTSRVLGSDEADVPFALLYLLDADRQQARLAGSVGVPTGSLLAPLAVDLAGKQGEVESNAGEPWPLQRVARTNRREVVTRLAGRWGDETVRARRELTPHTALVMPVTEPGQSSPSAILVAGVSPMLALDDVYEGFYELLVSHLSAGLASAHAYEEERRRAEALVAIDRAKTAFFSNVSHEFRTPLTLMLGPLEDLLARRAALSANDRADLDLVHRNGLRLLKLVNTLLDFARIEAGRVQASYEPTDLATYTADLASSFRSLVEKAGMRLEVTCPPLDGELAAPVYVDREMWEKIVLNLLSNAFKFTFEGSIAVALRAVDAGRAVELAVRDTGVGIAPVELPRLFERFHRVEGVRARTHEGSGIGLALVQDLVHLHGGTIRVESAAGVGTTFFVRLPTGTAHLSAVRVEAPSSLASTALGAATYVGEAERWLPSQPSQRISEGAGEGLSGVRDLEALPPGHVPAAQAAQTPRVSMGATERHARIVLADDNLDMREYLTRLVSAHYAVEAVANGAQALAAIRREPPDLVLSDVMMPELDGFGLLRELRADPQTMHLPVILLSARAGEEATMEGLEAGADDYLVKPFSAREVLSRVAARLEIARTRREALKGASELEAIVESVGDAIVLYDRHGNIARMNSAARQLFGLDGLPGYAQRPPQERATVISARDEQGAPVPLEHTGLQRLLRGEALAGPNAPDVRLQLADGREIEVNLTGAPLRDETGAVIGAVAVARDVTERRRLERQARWQASMLERAHDAIFMWELDGSIIYWNRGAESLYGFTREEALGRISHDLLHTQRPVSRADFEAALERDGEWNGELTHTTCYGRQVIVLSRHQLLREPDGRRYVLEVCRDITERKQLEQRTREALDALLAMAEVMVSDEGTGEGTGRTEATERASQVAQPQKRQKPQQEFSSALPIARRLAELTRGVLGCSRVSISAIEGDEQRSRPIAVVGLTAAQEAHWWEEQRALRGRPFRESMLARELERILAGETAMFDLTRPPYQYENPYGVTAVLAAPMQVDGRLVGLLALDFQSTETEDGPHVFTPEEAQLATAVARLCAIVLERERLLREQTAARARELALRETKRQMDEFLGIASHELRTPLTSIAANVQLAGRQLRSLNRIGQNGQEDALELDGQRSRVELAEVLLDRTGRQLARLDRLVGDLLDISRIQAGKLEMRLQPCDLVEITQEAVREQRAAWPNRGISLNVPRRATVPVVADADRVSQVMTNYLTNALKYSEPHQPVAMRVRVQGTVARVEVRDHGPGLTPEQQTHLFERFYRVPGVEQQSGSGVGLGLGLHICKTIVERHGGAVGVESAPGEGSTFWFELPLADPEADLADPEAD